MSDIPSSDKTQVRFRSRGSRPAEPAPEQEQDAAPVAARPAAGPSFMAMFFGAFAAVIAMAVVGGGIYFAATGLHSSTASSDGKSKNLLMESTSWQPGQEAAKNLTGDGDADIGWWARTFHLPKNEMVVSYLKGQGIDVSEVTPLHYEDTKDAASITYQVHAQVPQQLLRLEKVAWQPTDADLRPFPSVLVLNDGLPPGQLWNTQSPTVATEAGAKLNFSWRVNWDKTSNAVTTDKLPLEEGVFTQQQIAQFQSQTNTAFAQLKGEIQRINAQVDNDVKNKLAQVPANPSKPGTLSSKFGGDGSGEPTKSAERIGGGTLAGGAGGAAFGAAAGDAGLGAGIGAGVGLLGGLIYDGVSKHNDRERKQRAVASANAERMGDWRAQIKQLDKQRAQIKQDGVTEKQQLLQDLANRIASNNGHILASATEPAAVSDAPQILPTSSQPSGPIK